MASVAHFLQLVTRLVTHCCRMTSHSSMNVVAWQSDCQKESGISITHTLISTTHNLSLNKTAFLNFDLITTFAFHKCLKNVSFWRKCKSTLQTVLSRDVWIQSRDWKLGPIMWFHTRSESLSSVYLEFICKGYICT